jgi:hypothetical protein
VGAVTRREPDCIVELNRENANGGFTTLKLPALDKTRYGRDGTGSIDCLGRVPTKTRTSISVQKVRDEGHGDPGLCPLPLHVLEPHPAK